MHHTYFDALKQSMEWLAQQPKVLFIGQAVFCAGTSMSTTLKDIDISKRIELPVFEQAQLGISIGLSLQGYLPVSVFPRWNFFLLSIDQLVNHLDKYPLISDYIPKVIIRVGIGSVNPLDPNWQHKGNFTKPVRDMLKTVRVVQLNSPEQVLQEYKIAYTNPYSTILVEVSDFYDEEFRKKNEMFQM